MEIQIINVKTENIKIDNAIVLFKQCNESTHGYQLINSVTKCYPVDKQTKLCKLVMTKKIEPDYKRGAGYFVPRTNTTTMYFTPKNDEMYLRLEDIYHVVHDILIKSIEKN